MMSGRLIALEKQPGVRPVEVGETWQHLMANCVLQVTGYETKATCGTEQLDGGVEAGIEGVIHSMHLLWEQNYQEEEWGFLLVDVRNAFNKESRMSMLFRSRG